ncbi:MAG: ribose-phosphate diphosphokinase [Nanoarchaeota archaeon]
MMLVVGCSNSRDLAKNISKNLKCDYSDLTVKNFPDGELYLKFETELKNQDVVLVQSLHPSDEALLELIFAVHTAKDLGAKKVRVVIPYLAYIRQDKRFNPGECVSSKIVGSLLNVADEIITVDPHLHRFKSLNEVFKCKAIKLSANDLIQDYISKNFKDPVIIGPDAESYQWAQSIAKKIKASAAILEKERVNSYEVHVKLNSEVNVRDKQLIIIDDIISTGKTILEAIKVVKKLKPKSITVISIHGIFADKSTLDFIREYSTSIITTNTIKNPYSKIDVSKLISDSLK